MTDKKLETAEEYFAGHRIDYDNPDSRGLDLLDEGEVIDNVVNAFRSERFWMFAWIPVPVCNHIIRIIEETYYPPKTTKNREFALLMAPSYDVHWAAAAKKYLPRGELYDFLKKNATVSMLKQYNRDQFIKSNVDFIMMSSPDGYGEQTLMKTVLEFNDYYKKQLTGT